MTTSSDKKRRLSQQDVPFYSLSEAMRIPEAIANSYACLPSKPLAVAQAIDMSPNSSSFRMLCGAAIAYGLTDSGYNSDVISITDLGKSIVKPLHEGEEATGKKAAALKPKVLGEFFKKYNNNKIPKPDIAKNVLESLGVPKEHTERVFKLIIDTAKDVGFFRVIKGENYIDLQNAEFRQADITNEPQEDNKTDFEEPYNTPPSQAAKTLEISDAAVANNRVYISHGKNRSLVPSIQEFLKFGKFDPVISVERETVSKPVSDKVLDDMRSCGAAIIHVEAESKVSKDDGSHENIFNQNVLIEIGAAMALYGRRFVLLVQNGVKLPSNLQGLYEVRYEGEKLDAETAIKLMKAFNDMKNYVPSLNQIFSRPPANTKYQMLEP